MFYPVAVILVVLWYLGLATSHTLWGFIQILLMIAVLAVLFKINSRRSAVKAGGTIPAGQPVFPREHIPLNITTFLISFACASLITGCATSFPPPVELNNARQAYARASVSPAAQLAPENLYKAREALVLAEKSFRDNPQSEKTRDLATLAHREAKVAIELTTPAPDSVIIGKAEKDLQMTKSEILSRPAKVQVAQ
jgi:hypothetical protein